MTGRTLFTGLFVFIAVFAVALFYSINFAYYTKTNAESFELAGLEVTNYREIDGETSPIKFRACFSLPEGTTLYGEGEGATPLVAPFWFDCFDAKKLTEDLEAGTVNAVAFDDNKPFGVTSYIVVYPNGEGFAWRQRNECGDAVFSGEDAPEDCPADTAQNENSNG